MDFDAASTDCPFVRRLFDMVLACSLRVGDSKRQALFSEALCLELDAARAQAPEASQRVIRTVREMAQGALGASQRGPVRL